MELTLKLPVDFKTSIFPPHKTHTGQTQIYTNFHPIINLITKMSGNGAGEFKGMRKWSNDQLWYYRLTL